MKSLYKFKIGDTVECQKARIKIVGLITTPDGRPGYECVTANTKGEPWLVSQDWLSTSRKVRTKSK